MGVSCIVLEKPVAPGNKHEHCGYITHQDVAGVYVNSREDFRGDATFYPWHVVTRIDRDCGWR